MEIALAGLAAIVAVVLGTGCIALAVAFYPALVACLNDVLGAAINLVCRAVGRGWARSGRPRRG